MAHGIQYNKRRLQRNNLKINKMKNIHVLPTEHTSRLYYNSQERTYQLCEFPKYHTDIKSTHNLYITNSENIKEGDWVYSESRNKVCKVTGVSKWSHKDDYSIDLDNEDYYIHNSYVKKIILTTDQSLDGVQAIDDEFLEWFIKNPSCEEVEIAFEYNERSGYTDVRKIIIPKEEPKHICCGRCDGVNDLCISDMEHKQETLEEVAKRKFQNIGDRLIFEDGAKWQQERRYSEEDMKRAFCNGGQLDYSALTSTEFGTKILNKWFEQFKKK